MAVQRQTELIISARAMDNGNHGKYTQVSMHWHVGDYKLTWCVEPTGEMSINFTVTSNMTLWSINVVIICMIFNQQRGNNTS